MIKVNSAKAQELSKTMARAWREGEFAKNDLAIQDAILNGLDTAQVKARQQELRDLPAQFEGKTPEQLKDMLVNNLIIPAT